MAMEVKMEVRIREPRIKLKLFYVNHFRALPSFRTIFPPFSRILRDFQCSCSWVLYQ